MLDLVLGAPYPPSAGHQLNCSRFLIDASRNGAQTYTLAAIPTRTCKKLIPQANSQSTTAYYNGVLNGRLGKWHQKHEPLLHLNLTLTILQQNQWASCNSWVSKSDADNNTKPCRLQDITPMILQQILWVSCPPAHGICQNTA